MERTLTIRVIFDGGKADAPLRATNDGLKAVEGSLEDLRTKLNRAITVQNKYKSSTMEWAKANAEVTKYQRAYDSELANTMRHQVTSTRTTASMTMALQSMNFTIRDSPYFFRDFSLGVLAIGNNINPLIDSLIRVKQEAKAMGSTFRHDIWNALKGTGGVIFMFSVLVSALQAVVFWMDKNKTKAKESADDYAELSDKVKDLTASYEDLQKFQSTTNEEDEALKNRLKSYRDMLEKNILLDARMKKQGGVGIYTKEQLADVKKSVADYDQQIQNVMNSNENAVTEFQDRLKGLIEASKSGVKGILEFVEANKLSDSQLKAVASTFKKYSEEYFTHAGKMRSMKELPVGLPNFLLTDIKASRDDLSKTSDLIDKIFEKQKTPDIKLPFATEADLLKEKTSLETEREKSKSVYDRWQYTKEIYAIEYKLEEMKQLPDFKSVDYKAGQYSIDKAKSGKMQSPQSVLNVLADGKPKIPNLDSANKQLQLTDRLASTAGNSLMQLFANGKMGADELLKSLLAIGAQLVIIEGLKYIFSGGVSGIFGSLGFSQGGIMHASNGFMTGGYGAHDYIPAMLRSGELVLNPSQQAELFNIAKGIGTGSRPQNVRVQISGQIKANKNQFVADFKKAESNFNSTRVRNSIDRG